MRKNYTAEQLKEVLEKHSLWLNGGEDGERADLSSANLRSADLSSANLSSANLRYADLRYADLRYANLSSADLRSADLSSANLRYADLSSADLAASFTHNVYGQKIASIGNIGSRNAITVYHVDNDVVFCGCFKGSLDEFNEKVIKTYKEGEKHRKEYDLAISFFKMMKEENEHGKNDSQKTC